MNRKRNHQHRPQTKPSTQLTSELIESPSRICSRNPEKNCQKHDKRWDIPKKNKNLFQHKAKEKQRHTMFKQTNKHFLDIRAQQSHLPGDDGSFGKSCFHVLSGAWKGSNKPSQRCISGSPKLVSSLWTAPPYQNSLGNDMAVAVV